MKLSKTEQTLKFPNGHINNQSKSYFSIIRLQKRRLNFSYENVVKTQKNIINNNKLNIIYIKKPWQKRPRRDIDVKVTVAMRKLGFVVVTFEPSLCAFRVPWRVSVTLFFARFSFGGICKLTVYKQHS